jgi:hypothetical protein
LQLLQGGVYIAAEKSLGSGYIEVSTPGGAARLNGSSMVINFDQATQQTTVNCTQGSAVVEAGGTTVSLMEGTSTSFTPSGVPAAPQDFDQHMRDQYPQFWEMWEDRYLKPAIIEEPTITPELSSTPRPAATRTPTAVATWTPFALGPTSTTRVDGAIPTRRPTTTSIPGFTGLTPEEQANSGTFTYGITCQAWGKCVCDSANAVPSQSITITFDEQGVTLAGGENEVLAYPKAAPNLYRIESSDLTAEITFLMEGFEFFVVKGGQACQMQTFTRLP